MYPLPTVATLFLVALLRDVPRFVDGQSHVPVATIPSKTLVWERRINASLWLLQNRPCKSFISNGNCTQLRTRARNEMNVYTASAENQRGKLSAVLPDKIKLVPTSYDAVVVIDTYPQASFGHPVLVFFIELSSSPGECSRKRRSTYTDVGECVTIAQKSRRCTNRLPDRRRKRRCDINFIPTIFISKEGRKSPILKCMSRLAGFGNCARRMTQDPLNPNCMNSKRCDITPKPVKQYFCIQTCDYAVMLSGGWNGLTSTAKAKDNVRSMWRYFRQNGFKHKNILVFVGDRYSMETDGDPNTKDSIPAKNEFKIRGQIKDLCGSYCVDSLVIYLNKPTKSNGGMLVWDENEDGFAEESERYDVKEFIDDLRNCRANQVTVIADQSFSGVLLEKFRSAKRHSSRGSLKNVLMVASANANENPVYGSFTKSWVNARYLIGNRPRCLKEIITDVMTVDTGEFEANYENGSQGLLDRTIYGGSCNKNFHPVERKRKMGCRFVRRHHWRNMNNGRG